MTTDPIRARAVTLFLAGDVMTGRGIDQILPRPGDPRLFEPYLRSALEYVALAERASGAFARPVGFDYIWGDALAELERVNPDARIVNLETAVTASDEAWPHKGIHYRMHPGNVPCLGAAALDCCVLANNHVLDWGRAGLTETLATLHAAGLRTAGAGRDAAEAQAPAVIECRQGGRVLVFGLASETSGVPRDWAAAARRPGVSLLEDLSARSAEAVARRIAAHRREGDIVVASIHWGGNWGYDVAPEQRVFARALIDAGVVDVVHGHSSHHAKGIEMHRGRPILYGCGDLITDYEGIEGYEAFRPELSLMYFPTLDADSGRLLEFALTPMRLRRMRLERAAHDDAAWLRIALGRLGTRLEARGDGRLVLRWGES
ncbi:MAG TPA: CapA family protein [Burkholderiales bacterium]|nr:CapA family protein [Burkholderiales bacterium]